MSDQFQIVNKFAGYIERDDITNIPPNHLVIGSQNVISTDGRRVGNRKGYTLYGQENSALFGIESSYDWLTNKGYERHLRSFDNSGTITLQAEYNDLWYTIGTGYNRALLRYSEFWLPTEGRDVLLFVDGSTDIFEWSGGMTTYASSTTTTITKEGTTTWADDGFFMSNTRKVTIGGIEYTYTGGENSLTLTGVTPDPTAGGHVAGDIVTQTVRTYSDVPASDATYTGTNIAFVNSNPDTITRTTGSWVTSGFIAGDIITVSGSVSNNRTYTIDTVTALTLTLIANDAVTAEAAGASITITAYRPFTNDYIATLRNQLYIGSSISRNIEVSKVGIFYDFSAPSVPRAVGEAATLTLDQVCVGFVTQEENMYISAGLSQWYLTRFDLSADLQDEILTVDRLKTAPQQATKSQEAIFKIKNDVVFISNENTLDSIGRIELIQTPQSVPFSDPVARLFNRLDFTNCSGIYYNDNMYIAVPGEGLVLIYNMIENFWEAPQTLSISRFSIIDGLLYGHSSVVPETYELFTGYNDNGNAITAIAAFSYQNFGTRTDKKVFQEWYSEGYIQSNSILNLLINYDYTGITSQQTFEINPACTNIMYNVVTDGSLGKFSLGKANLAGSLQTIDESLPPKFRMINTTIPIDFYEMQPVYYSDGVDMRWELLACGAQVYISKSSNSSIKDCVL